MRFKIEMGRYKSIKTLEEVNAGIGDINFINDQVKYVVSCLVEMIKNNEKINGAGVVDALSYYVPQKGNEFTIYVKVVD
jgi:hypothetical protein